MGGGPGRSQAKESDPEDDFGRDGHLDPTGHGIGGKGSGAAVRPLDRSKERSPSS